MKPTIMGGGLGCGVYRLEHVAKTTTSEEIEEVLSRMRYGNQYSCAFIYTIVSPTWKKAIAALTKHGFDVAVKNSKAMVMLKPTGKQ